MREAGAERQRRRDALGSVSQQLAGDAGRRASRASRPGCEWLDAGRPQEALAQLTPPRRREDAAPRPRAPRASAGRYEALGQLAEAAAAALAAADEPGSAVACAALCRRRPSSWTARGRRTRRSRPSSARRGSARDSAPAALLELGTQQLARGERAAAAAAFDRLDREYPAHAGGEAGPRAPRRASAALPPRTAGRARATAARARLRPARRGAHRRGARGPACRAAREPRPPTRPTSRASGWAARSCRAGGARRAARCCSKVGAELAATPPRPPTASRAESARRTAHAGGLRGGRRPLPRDALGRRGAAVAREPLPEGRARRRRRCPSGAGCSRSTRTGRYAERAAWRVGWADYRAGRFEEAAQTFETHGAARPPARPPPGLLYWAGRARLALGQDERARALLEETVRALQARLPRRARPGRARPHAAASRRRRRRSPPRRPRRSCRCPSRARAASASCC